MVPCKNYTPPLRTEVLDGELAVHYTTTRLGNIGQVKLFWPALK